MSFLLIFIGTLSAEISNSIGKHAVAHKKQTLYSMGFLTMFWSVILFSSIVLLGADFTISTDSFHLFIPRVILEIILAHVTIKSIIVADRTTVSFVRMISIPLLLMVDLIIGYDLLLRNIWGIVLLLAALFVLLWRNPSGQKGLSIVLLGSVLAVVTTSLFKYNITFHNSVAAEQLIISIALLLYFFSFSTFKLKEKPWHLLTQRTAQIQSLTHGIAALLMSFAYLFAPASIIISLKRSLTVFWATASGRLVFHEKNIIRKIVALAIGIIGIALLL